MYEIALVAHLIGVVLGLGAATVSDIQFVKALKDEKITKAEDNLLSGASLVIWIGIGIMLVSGAIMFAMNWDVLIGQSRMLAHVSIAAVIIANGLWLNISIGPRLASWSQKKAENQQFVPEYKKIRKIAFISGAVSFTSWWTTFALGMARRFVFSPPSYAEYMGLYALILGFAIGGALFIEHMSWQWHTKGQATRLR